jgi:hypothetical protein
MMIAMSTPSAAPRELRYEGIHCTLTLQQPAPSVIVLRISGSDVGEFAEVPMQALDCWLQDAGRVQFFIDARDVRGASIEVSGEWARWLGAHKDSLTAVTMLTGSRFIQMTAEFVRRFAALQGIMQICTEPAVFDFALNSALQQ